MEYTGILSEDLDKFSTEEIKDAISEAQKTCDKWDKKIENSEGMEMMNHIVANGKYFRPKLDYLKELLRIQGSKWLRDMYKER